MRLNFFGVARTAIARRVRDLRERRRASRARVRNCHLVNGPIKLLFKKGRVVAAL